MNVRSLAPRLVAGAAVVLGLSLAMAPSAGAMTTSNRAYYSQPGAVSSNGTTCYIDAPRVNIAAGDVASVVVTVHNRRTTATTQGTGLMYPGVTGYYWDGSKWSRGWKQSTNYTDVYDVEWLVAWFHNGTAFYAEHYYAGVCQAPPTTYISSADYQTGMDLMSNWQNPNSIWSS